MTHDHYTTLGVAPDATPEAITRAYRQLAMQWHPDRNPGSAEATRRMQAINAAYAVLRDPRRRARYDALLRDCGWWEATPEERARHGSPEAMARAARRASGSRAGSADGEGEPDGTGAAGADGDDARDGDEETVDEAQLAAHLAAVWWPAAYRAREAGDVAALRALFVDMLGPLHAHAERSTGPLGMLWRSAIVFVREAEEATRAAAEADDAPPRGETTSPRPSVGRRRPGKGRRVLRRLLLAAAALLLWQSGVIEVAMPERLARSLKAVSRAAAAEPDLRTRLEADDRARLQAELRRLSDAMAAAYTPRAGFPSRPPRTFRPKGAINVRVGRAPDGWVGVATGDLGTTCWIDVTLRARARARETIRCGERQAVRGR